MRGHTSQVRTDIQQIQTDLQAKTKYKRQKTKDKDIMNERTHLTSKDRHTAKSDIGRRVNCNGKYKDKDLELKGHSAQENQRQVQI